MKNLFNWFNNAFIQKDETSDDDLGLIYEDEDLIPTTDFEKFDNIRIAYCGSKC